MRVVVNSPKSLSLSVLRTELAETFPPHFLGNLWNWLLCQANLGWQLPAGTHTQTHMHMHAVPTHSVWTPAWRLGSSPSLLKSWLTSVCSQSANPPGSFTLWREEKTWQKETDWKEKWERIAEVKEKKRPVSAPRAVKSQCFEKLKNFSFSPDFLCIFLMKLPLGFCH